MIRALFAKSIYEARLLLVGLAAMLFAFNWMFVWVSSTFDTGAFEVILRTMPKWFERLLGVPLAGAVSPAGKIALGYVDPVVVVFGITAWGIARGTDVVAGEVGRGTMEWLAAQPVRRVWIVLVQAVVTTIGAATLAVAALAGTAAGLAGTAAGLATVSLPEATPLARFVPAAANLFGLMVCLAGLSTFVSSLDSTRWRPVGIMCSVYAASLAIKLVARLAPGYGWLMHFTFLGAFEPQRMIIEADRAAELMWRSNLTLLGLGLLAYLVALAVFARRDLPAPV